MHLLFIFFFLVFLPFSLFSSSSLYSFLFSPQVFFFYYFFFFLFFVFFFIFFKRHAYSLVIVWKAQEIDSEKGLDPPIATVRIYMKALMCQVPSALDACSWCSRSWPRTDESRGRAPPHSLDGHRQELSGRGYRRSRNDYRILTVSRRECQPLRSRPPPKGPRGTKNNTGSKSLLR